MGFTDFFHRDEGGVTIPNRIWMKEMRNEVNFWRKEDKKLPRMSIARRVVSDKHSTKEGSPAGPRGGKMWQPGLREMLAHFFSWRLSR